MNIDYHDQRDAYPQVKIALVGAGTIGLSFAALHISGWLSSSSPAQHASPSRPGSKLALPKPSITIFDSRSDIQEHVRKNLPTFFPTNPSFEDLESVCSITISQNLRSAVKDADIVQESGPEDLDFKRTLWAEVSKYAPTHALFWSSTSGISASSQSQNLQAEAGERVVVVHPYNPPHIMPLLEIVPSPRTRQDVVDQTILFWQALGRMPTLIRKECTGFVANRLAFALFREAISLVNQGVVSIEHADQIVQSSMGPRWSVAGPFKSYHAGGGEGGLAHFFRNVGPTVEACWKETAKDVNLGHDVGAAFGFTPGVGMLGPDGNPKDWRSHVFDEVQRVYGKVDVGERDRITRKVLEAVKEGKLKERETLADEEGER